MVVFLMIITVETVTGNSENTIHGASNSSKNAVSNRILFFFFCLKTSVSIYVL